MASRVTKSGARDRRFSNQAKGLGQRVIEQGGAPAARSELGEMPLTLFLVVAGVILWLYIRRASLGIDQHPGEKPAAPGKRPTVTIRPKASVLP